MLTSQPQIQDLAELQGSSPVHPPTRERGRRRKDFLPSQMDPLRHQMRIWHMALGQFGERDQLDVCQEETATANNTIRLPV